MQSRPLLPHNNIEWTIEHNESRLKKSNVDPHLRLQVAKLSLSHGLFHGGGEPALSKALAQAKKVLHDDRNSIEAMAIAGTALVKLERVDKANQYLSMALQREADNALLSFALSAFARLNGDINQMLQHLERTLDLAPTAWEPHAMLGRMLCALAEPSQDENLRDRALYHLLVAIDLFPDVKSLMPAILLDLGALCLKQNHFNHAERFLVKLKNHPKYGLKAKRHLAEVAFQMKKYHNAIQRFRTYLNQKEAVTRSVAAQNRDRSNNATIQAKIAISWFSLGDLRRAKAECQRALQIDPTHLLARHTLGSIFIKQGAYAEGLREFRENLHQHPEYIKSYQELVRLYKNAGDWEWLSQALLSEVSNYDRLPIGGVIDARVCTRARIQVIIDELKETGGDGSTIILPVVAMTQDELLRFQLWEAACDIAERVAAQNVEESLSSPSRNYGVATGEDALSAAKYVSLDRLIQGLNIQYADIKAAALERYPQAHSLEEHQRNEKSETRVARSYQMLLLLACSFHHDSRVSELFKRWTSGQNDRNMEIATWVGWSLKNHPEAIGRLRAMTKDRQASPKLLQLLAQSTIQMTATSTVLKIEDKVGSCRSCQRKHTDVSHFILGQNIQVCNYCVQEAFNAEAPKYAHHSHSCSLCGNTHLESQPLCKANSVVICKKCAQLSLGHHERAYVARSLSL